MLILDILFKLAVIVMVLTFAGMAWATFAERRKYATANVLYTRQIKAQLDEAARRERETVMHVVGPWLSHMSYCSTHRPLACDCGLREALISLELPH